MHIIQLAWLKGGSVPPLKYGGIERMVGVLSAELVRQGHFVTLIAPKDSHIKGCDVVWCDDFVEAANIIATLKADVVHDHSCWALESPVRQGLKIPFLSTTHVNHAIGWSKNVVYLSKSQRTQHGIQLERGINQSPVVYVPIDPNLHPLGLPRQDYLLFLGMVAEYKGVLEAAEIASYLGRKLIVAGPAWGAYADQVKSHPWVEYVGEVGDPYRSQLLEQAYAVMCLHNDFGGWQEPGCGVVGEAYAFNTPVAALKNGCLPELVDYPTGWIGNSVSDIRYKMKFEDHYPTAVRETGLKIFGAEHIVQQYVNLYQQLLEGRTWG